MKGLIVMEIETTQELESMGAGSSIWGNFWQRQVLLVFYALHGLSLVDMVESILYEEASEQGELFEALIQSCSTRAQEALASSSLMMMAGIDKSLAGFTQLFFPVDSLVSKASLKSISTTNVNDRCSLSAIA